MTCFNILFNHNKLQIHMYHKIHLWTNINKNEWSVPDHLFVSLNTYSLELGQ